MLPRWKRPRQQLRAALVGPLQDDVLAPVLRKGFGFAVGVGALEVGRLDAGGESQGWCNACQGDGGKGGVADAVDEEGDLGVFSGSSFLDENGRIIGLRRVRGDLQEDDERAAGSATAVAVAVVEGVASSFTVRGGETVMTGRPPRVYVCEELPRLAYSNDVDFCGRIVRTGGVTDALPISGVCVPSALDANWASCPKDVGDTLGAGRTGG